MPNVNDIANLAEALEKHPVIVVGDRCVAVRNRNATCRKCVQACPFDALKVEANELTLDATSCVGCGACIGICPTEALVSAESPDNTLSVASIKALEHANGVGVIACARISSKHLADPEQYLEVSCLARVDESIVVELAAQGASSVMLVDGVCKTCKYRDCISGVEETMDQARLVIQAGGSACTVERASSFPDELLIEDATGMFGSTRRRFFSDAVGAARETAMVAAKTTIEQELGMKAQEAAIGERLRVTKDGSLPTIDVPRHDRLLNAFDALGAQVGERLDSRKFATVSIDAEKCNSCGMCAVFCPTGALRRNETEKASDPITSIEFSASECINCSLCKDVCWEGALTLEEGVAFEQLYDFEPKVFHLRDARKNKSPFGSFSL